MGIYVGRLPAHASNVGLILNPRTGHVSPQFHVMYDNNFTTVQYLQTGKVSPHWEKLFQQSAQFDHFDNQKDTWQSLESETTWMKAISLGIVMTPSPSSENQT